MAEKKYIIDNEKLMAEWDWDKNNEIGLDPKTITHGSNKKAWWKCRNDHNWNATISTRVNGASCPYCSNLKVWIGFNDLETTMPNLAIEWHPTKNVCLTPQMVTSGSGKKVWWLGACGHEWQQTVSNRKNGQGCPVCMKDKISKKVSKIHIERSGSLAEKFPDLAKEWHPSKNATLTPYDLTGGSTTPVWWLGMCGHEWKASPLNRTRGTKCPYCSNQKVLEGFNDLESNYPWISKEWHPIKNGDILPNQIISGSNKKVWWLGECGHEWEQSISKRTLYGRGCPICAKKLQTSFPEQALYYYIKKFFKDAVNAYKDIFNDEMEIDIYIPTCSVGIEYDGFAWHNNLNAKKREKKKYEICKNHNVKLIRIIEEYEECGEYYCDDVIFTKRHPKYEELNKLIIRVLKFLDKSIVQFDVDIKRDDVEIRSQYITGSVSKSFLEFYPNLENEWHKIKNKNLNPHMFSVSSGVSVWWKCEKGHEWQTRICDRTRRNSKCPYCSNKKVLKGFNDLATTHPTLILEWLFDKNKDVSPFEVTKSSKKLVWWKCSKCGCEWKTTIQNRTRGFGCPECAKRKRKSK